MLNAESEAKLKCCPVCKNSLQTGYVLGKQSRIHWSDSPKGMTIFHGVPLMRMDRAFWRRKNWWLRTRRFRIAMYRMPIDLFWIRQRGGRKSKKGNRRLPDPESSHNSHVDTFDLGGFKISVGATRKQFCLAAHDRGGRVAAVAVGPGILPPCLV
ncbi:MAG: PF20097 family protein [Gammaproteobacteria bacterium]